MKKLVILTFYGAIEYFDAMIAGFNELISDECVTCIPFFQWVQDFSDAYHRLHKIASEPDTIVLWQCLHALDTLDVANFASKSTCVNAVYLSVDDRPLIEYDRHYSQRMQCMDLVVTPSRSLVCHYRCAAVHTPPSVSVNYNTTLECRELTQRRDDRTFVVCDYTMLPTHYAIGNPIEITQELILAGFRTRCYGRFSGLPGTLIKGESSWSMHHEIYRGIFINMFQPKTGGVTEAMVRCMMLRIPVFSPTTPDLVDILQPGVHYISVTGEDDLKAALICQSEDKLTQMVTAAQEVIRHKTWKHLGKLLLESARKLGTPFPRGTLEERKWDQSISGTLINEFDWREYVQSNGLSAFIHTISDAWKHYSTIGYQTGAFFCSTETDKVNDRRASNLNRGKLCNTEAMNIVYEHVLLSAREHYYTRTPLGFLSELHELFQQGQSIDFTAVISDLVRVKHFEDF